MPQRNINFSPKQDQFIATMLEVGEFSNASEVVRAAMRMLLDNYEQREIERAKWLRQEAQVGLQAYQQGDCRDITNPDERQKILAQIRQEAKTSAENHLSGTA